MHAPIDPIQTTDRAGSIKRYLDMKIDRRPGAGTSIAQPGAGSSNLDTVQQIAGTISQLHTVAPTAGTGLNRHATQTLGQRRHVAKRLGNNLVKMRIRHRIGNPHALTDFHGDQDQEEHDGGHDQQAVPQVTTGRRLVLPSFLLVHWHGD